jgi:hypothetical protein
MAKSRRTCYFTDQKDLWSPRPMRFWASNKKNKVMCHRIERAWERELILWELKQLE